MAWLPPCSCLGTGITRTWALRSLAQSASVPLGRLDDLVKIRTARAGLSPRSKLLGQIFIGAVASLLVYRASASGAGLDLSVSGLHFRASLDGWFVPVSVLVIVASSNAVNLTDGLDGLAGGCLICANGRNGCRGVCRWPRGMGVLLESPICSWIGRIAGCGGRHDWRRARFFVVQFASRLRVHGEYGALPLGGLLGLLAVVSRQRLAASMVGGVFVVEAASVIAQVASFRLRGKRVLLCAPLHHHFQYKVGRKARRGPFLDRGLAMHVLGLAVLKLRTGQIVTEPTAWVAHRQSCDELRHRLGSRVRAHQMNIQTRTKRDHAPILSLRAAARQAISSQGWLWPKPSSGMCRCCTSHLPERAGNSNESVYSRRVTAIATTLPTFAHPGSRCLAFRG